MLELSNLRKERWGEWVRLVCDLRFSWERGGGQRTPFTERTMWFAVPAEKEGYFSEQVYDPFLLVCYYIGMYYGQDVAVRGKVSRRLYFNLTNYVWKILCNYSDHMRRIRVETEGFGTVEPGASLVGTGSSCGVDSLLTIRERYVEMEDENYRVNHLFLFNCGTHGDYEDPRTRRIWLERCELSRDLARDLELPFTPVDSNLHAFTHRIGEERMGYFAIYACALSLQRAVRLYYSSSDYEYEQIRISGPAKRDIDLSEYAGPYLVPLIRTDTLEIIVDGSQYYRTEKIERISDWEIAQRYLNVCVRPLFRGANCSHCVEKCMPTMFTLETMGKLGRFTSVFDRQVYREHLFDYECRLITDRKRDGFTLDNYQYARRRGRRLPPAPVAWAYRSPALIKARLREILGERTYGRLRALVRGNVRLNG